jgi:hypothetical protein
MPRPLDTPRNRRAIFSGAVGRGLLVASVWIFVAGLAITPFSGGVEWDVHGLVPAEVLGFACGLLVAGTITGVAALATSGERRAAIGFGVIMGLLFAAAMPTLRWVIGRLTSPNPDWARSEWVRALDGMTPGLALGVAIGLGIATLVFASGFLSRRMAPWKFGIVAAIVIAMLALWVLPEAISLLTDRALLYLRAQYGFRYDEALRGAAVAVGPGAFGGAIVGSLLARWFGGSPGRPA